MAPMTAWLSIAGGTCPTGSASRGQSQRVQLVFKGGVLFISPRETATAQAARDSTWLSQVKGGLAPEFQVLLTLAKLLSLTRAIGKSPDFKSSREQLGAVGHGENACLASN